MACELQIQTPDAASRRVELDSDSCSIGRAKDNSLCYPEDASLSRQHLVLEKDDAGWWVKDLRSKNGTFVNGTRISERQRMQSGDRLSAGQLSILFRDPEQDTSGAVYFVPESGPELHPSATVMTSLEGLLSGERTEPTTAAVKPDTEPVKNIFGTPVVQALIRAGRELAGRQPLQELFNLILGLSIEAVGAERGVLMTLDGEGDRGLVARAVHGDGFHISTAVRDRVLNEKSSVLVQNIQQDALKNQLSISEQQINSLMAVPLQTENKVIGLIYVDSRLFVREFTTDDLNLLTVLANVAAIRIDHARYLELQRQEQRRTIDLEQAAEIQRAILPGDAPELPGYDVAGHNAPSRMVGGDYYDFFEYSDGRLGIVLADVAGKGMSAALLMSNLQARVQTLFAEPTDLAGKMALLDRSIAKNCPANRFITMFMCVADPLTGQVEFCNAGHNPPLVVRSSGEVELVEQAGTVLGILPELGYTQSEYRLEEGDLVAIYSDGVTEALTPDDEEYGMDRLTEVLLANREKQASEIVDAVNKSLSVWMATASAADDVTLVVARRIKR